MGVLLKISDIYCGKEFIDYLCGMTGAVAYTSEEVARRIGEALGLGDILVRSRAADLVAARAVFHRVCFLYLGMTIAETAAASGRSYSIVYYDVVRFPERLKYDFRLRRAWDGCRGVLDWLQSPDAPRKPCSETPERRLF